MNTEALERLRRRNDDGRPLPQPLDLWGMRYVPPAAGWVDNLGAPLARSEVAAVVNVPEAEITAWETAWAES